MMSESECLASSPEGLAKWPNKLAGFCGKCLASGHYGHYAGHTPLSHGDYGLDLCLASDQLPYSKQAVTVVTSLLLRLGNFRKGK